MIDVEKIARILYDCEKARAESARNILAGGKPSGCEGILMEPYEECAEAFRSDARAVVAAMQAREKAEPWPRDDIRRELIRFHRDSCYPQATDFEVDEALLKIGVLTASVLIPPPTSAVSVVEQYREHWLRQRGMHEGLYPGERVRMADEIICALKEAGHD